MKFNSQSVLLNRGVNYRVPIETPPSFQHYTFSKDAMNEAIAEFNKRLDKRPHVTAHFDGIKVDVLRIVPQGDTMALWLAVKEKDIDTLHEMCFTIQGEVVFAENSETHVDKVIIHDLMYDEDKGVFASKKKH